jgi:hypothetical protein
MINKCKLGYQKLLRIFKIKLSILNKIGSISIIWIKWGALLLNCWILVLEREFRKVKNNFLGV